VRAYLLTIARRLCARAIRRRSHRMQAERQAGEAPFAQAAGATFEGEEILADLAAEDRTLVLARAVWDLPFREIGKQLGRSENWARVRYFRLVARLRESNLGEGGCDRWM